MPDLLIRNLSQDELDALDVHAKRAGVSRAEYVRDRLRAEARLLRSRPPVMADLDTAAALASDLLDPEVMAAAWR
jgi:plasmid stability protein